MRGKIAIEEHFVPAGLEELISNPGWPEHAWRKVLGELTDVSGERLERMDRCGIEMAVLSLGADGIQARLDVADAVGKAVASNDALAEIVALRPDRFGGFAALPMQNPIAAADELQRAVEQLGFCGALVNGFSNRADASRAQYYDAEAYLPFWERVAALGVPVYLHPRNPLLGQRLIYEGREELLGPTWAFAVETGTHALRLITSGLFDRFPGVNVILGHLGEFVPFAINRLEQRLGRRADVSLSRSPTQCVHENFYVTTSGNYHTASLLGVLLEMGADRVLFAADYPFEAMHEASDWLDDVPISDADRRKIASDNAKRLLAL